MSGVNRIIKAEQAEGKIAERRGLSRQLGSDFSPSKISKTTVKDYKPKKASPHKK